MQCDCTFEEWGDVPHVDAAGLHELSQGDLQEEDGDPSHEDDQQVGDQEDACGDRERASGPGVDQSHAGSGKPLPLAPTRGRGGAGGLRPTFIGLNPQATCKPGC